MRLRLLRAPSFWAILVLLAGAYVLTEWVQSVGGPAAIRERFGVAAPLVTGSIQVVLAPTPFPTDLIAIAHGTLYGFWFAAPLNWCAWWLGALLQYALGRRARSDFDLEPHLARLPDWLRRFPIGHPMFLIGVRQIPWAGGYLTTIVPGALGVPATRVAWCAAVGIVPGATVLAAVGAGLLELSG